MSAYATAASAAARLLPLRQVSLLRRRTHYAGGILLMLVGLALLLALASYHPGDPSLDTATAAAARNLAGRAGAMAADALLQGFGLAGVLPALVLLGNGWRVASRRPMKPVRRIIALALGMPAAAALLALLPESAHWPANSGLGGAIGQVLGSSMIALVPGQIGLLWRGAIITADLLVTLGLILLSLGLSMQDCRAAARFAGTLWRLSLGLGQGGAGLARRGPGAIAWLFHPLAGSARPADLPRRPAAQDAGARPGRAEPARLDPEDQDEDEMDALPAILQPSRQAALSASRPQPAAAPGPAISPRKAAAARKAASRQESLPLETGGWQFPPLSLLHAAPARPTEGPSAEALQNNARLLESVLSDYGVQGAIREIRPGPVVTLYELEPAPGIRSARVIGLADDIARSLSVTSVRIATVPGRNVIGIEVPNPRRETVFFSDLITSEAWEQHPGRLVLALGKDIGGEPVVADLSRMPHLLIAGTTGSGKSVGINAMILSLLYRVSPEQCRLILIDPKMLELSVYEGIPHLMAPVVTEPRKAVTALKWTVREMERRYRAMSQLGVRNIAGYNERVAEARGRGEAVTRRVQTGFDEETGRPVFEDQPLALEPMFSIVVVIDEMADLMMVAGKEIEAAVQRLAQMARAAGIHVIMATQRPSVDVITGTIKANFPTRISFQVISKFDSRTILGEQGAEQLLGQGDLLHMVGGGRITRVHGPFVTDQEVEQIVDFLRAQGEPAFIEEVTEADENEPAEMAPTGGEGERGLYDDAVALVARERKASTSFIQRHLQIGYNRAARLIEQMEKAGVVGPANHVGKREVLLPERD